MMHPKIKNIWSSTFQVLWFKNHSLSNNFFTSLLLSQNTQIISEGPILESTFLSSLNTYLNTYDASGTAGEQ